MPPYRKGEKMITCGIDIGKGKHAVAIVDEHGRQVVRTRFYGNTRTDADKLLAELLRHAEPAQIHVGMESTGSYWRAYYDFLTKAGCTVDVINPIITSASSAGDIRGRKTDKRDAESIAEVVLRGKYVSRRADGLEERKLRALTRQRGFLVDERTSAKLHLASSVAEAFAEFEALFDEPYGTLALAVLSKYPTARHLSCARRTSVARIVQAHTRGKDADAEAKRLIDAAKDSISLACEITDPLARCIVSSIETIRCLDERIEDIDTAIEEFAPPKIAETLMSIKGAGKVMPMVVAAEFGDISRFKTSAKTGSESGMHKRLLAYAGCDPRIRESGKWKGRTFISKRGSRQLRSALYLMGNNIRQWDPYFKSVYERKIESGKHHNVAVFYVVAKLLEVLCSLYKSGRSYTVAQPSSYQQGE